MRYVTWAKKAQKLKVPIFPMKNRYFLCWALGFSKLKLKKISWTFNENSKSPRELSCLTIFPIFYHIFGGFCLPKPLRERPRNLQKSYRNLLVTPRGSWTLPDGSRTAPGRSTRRPAWNWEEVCARVPRAPDFRLYIDIYTYMLWYDMIWYQMLWYDIWSSLLMCVGFATIFYA